MSIAGEIFEKELKKQGVKQLKFRVGERIMGYSQIMGVELLVGGIILDIEQSKISIDNEYSVKLDQRVCGEGIPNTWWIDEKDAISFDEDRFVGAMNHDNERKRAKKAEREEYIAMLKELYPERYLVIKKGG